MDHYDRLLLQQLAPLFIVDNRFQSPATAELVNRLASFNIADKVWDNSIINTRMMNTKYIIKVPKGDAVGDMIFQDALFHRSVKREGEHNSLSPFNLHSDLFPNGILSEKWFKKYTSEFPFAVVTIFKMPDDSSEDEAFLKILNELKTKYTNLQIKFTAIIVSSNYDSSSDDARIVRYRQITGLAQLTGIVYLNTADVTAKRDTDILVNALLPSLRPFAVEFYSNIEYKIRQRYKKYYTCPPTNAINTVVELTPKFLELRNLVKQSVINQLAHPHNTETILKSFEIAYGSAVDILGTSLSSLIETKDVSEHDLKLYAQLRTLTDVIAFHIVRGYLSIEDPIAALKKHQAHIDNVLHVTSSFGIVDSEMWTAIQYQWLAELLVLVPKSVLKGLHTKFQKKTKNAKIFEFVGGLQILDTYDFRLLTHPGLLYMKSSSLVSKSLKKASKFSYLPKRAADAPSRIDLLEKGLRLLEEPSKSRSNTEEDKKITATYVVYAQLSLAEEYFNLKEQNLTKALEYYNDLLHYARGQSRFVPTSSSSWDSLVVMLLERIFSCYQAANDSTNSLVSLLKMANIESSLVHNRINLSHKLFDDFQDGITIDLKLKDSEKIYDVKALLVNENSHKSETIVYDTMVTQLVIRSSFCPNSLKSMLGDSELSILRRIELIHIKYSENLTNVRLKHDEQSKSKVFNEIRTLKTNHSELQGDLGLSSDDDRDQRYMKIVNVNQVVERAGILLIQSIVVNLSIYVTRGSKTIQICILEETNIPTNQSAHPVSHTYMYKTGPRGHFSTPIRLYRNSIHAIQVLPLRPDISVTMAKDIVDCIIVGEKLLIPLVIKYTHPEKHKITFDELLLSPSATIVFNDPDSSYNSSIKTRINWEGLKDDEGLDLKSLASSDDDQGLHILNIEVHRDNFADDEGLIPYRVVIDLKTMVKEFIEGEPTGEYQDLDIYDTAVYDLPVIDNAFNINFIISPRYSSGTVAEIPNPFIIGSHDPDNDKSMPINTRLWKSAVLVVDKLKAYETDDPSSELEILLYELNVRTKNPELIIDLVKKSTRDAQCISQLFTTRSKHGLLHRNVSVLTSVIINWRRKGSTTEGANVNVFQSEESEIVLPLSDPRVLLSASEDLQAENGMKIKYIIENPTPRIFTFNTQLEADERWVFSDTRNIFPFKHQMLPVLPFSKQVIEYYGRCVEHQNGAFKLPQLKVYDVNFKVSLPTLSVCDEITLKDKAFYWKRL